MNCYFQTSAPQCTFCCPHLHKMKMEIENIVTKHLKFVACMTALFQYDGRGWTLKISLTPPHLTEVPLSSNESERTCICVIILPIRLCKNYY